MKNLFMTFATVLAVAGFAHAEDSRTQDPTGITQISQDQRLDSSACLRMLSSVECKAHGYAEPGAYQSHGSCQMKVAFQLSSGENVIHELNSSSDNGGYGGGFTELSGGLLGVWSLGLFDQVLASGASHTSLGHAEDNLRFNLKKMAEELELKGVAKCRDFKDNSSKINSVTSSTTD